MTLIEIFWILIVHWIADFVVQTDKQAKEKSKSVTALLSHTFQYSIIFMICMFIYIVANTPLATQSSEPIYNVFKFTVITFWAHTITDYFTSKLNSRLWAAGKTHNFFVSVGFDQVLHYVQLFLTFYIIYK